MTKQELLDYIAKRVDALVGVEILTQSNALGDNFYLQNVRKVFGQSVAYENIRFVVCGEGLGDDRAFFFETDEIRFPNVHEDVLLREKLFPVAPEPTMPVPPIVVK